MKINKRLVTILTAIAFAAIPVGGLKVNAATSSNDFSTMKVSAVYSYSVKYTGKPIADVPINLSDKGGKITAKNNVDYKFTKFQKIDNINVKPDDNKWTSGIPTTPGCYSLMFSGIGDYTGENHINLWIADTTDLSFYSAYIRDDLYVEKSNIGLSLNYFDSTVQRAYTKYLTIDKDYSFVGWSTKNSGWKTTPTKKESVYNFKFTGLGDFKNTTNISKLHVNSVRDVDKHKYSMGSYYNPKTKAYEDRIRTTYLTEGKDYTVNYCNASEIDDSEKVTGITSSKYSWKSGYPKKSGEYAFLIKSKAPNKKDYAFITYYSKEPNPQIIKKSSVLSGLLPRKINKLVICPSKTKEYTIVAETTASIRTCLYDDTYKRVGYSINAPENNINANIKVTLEAGRPYYLTIETRSDDNMPCKISIDNSYKFRNPKTIKKSNCLYVITKSADVDGLNGEAALVCTTKKNIKDINVASVVKLNGKIYKVTFIKRNAFAASKDKLQSVTLGKNIESICSGVFLKCKKVKTITIKTKNLKSIDKNVFYSKKKIKFIMPDSKKKAYKKLIKAA